MPAIGDEQEQKFEMRAGECGHKWHFHLRENGAALAVAEGTDTITVKVYEDVDDVSTDTFETSSNITFEDGNKGHVYYTVQSGDIITAGNYWIQVLVNGISMINEVYLIVHAEYSRGD